MNKEEIRREMRARRRALDEGEQARCAQAMLAHVTGFEPYAHAACVMAYMACRGELDLMPVIAHILSSGKTLALPRCEAPGVMTARKVERMDQLCCGMYGLPEPDERCEIIAPQQIDLVLTPGTAFDMSGGRIGQGGGYYDRFLRETHALRVGVCHSFALLERVPAQAHDINMDAVMTPDGVVWIDDKYRRI
jgi:5-formyltetrahydrofolate cyclo-ligase